METLKFTNELMLLLKMQCYSYIPNNYTQMLVPSDKLGSEHTNNSNSMQNMKQNKLNDVYTLSK